MITTLKRHSIAMTKDDLRMLDELSDFYGEKYSAIYKRALIFLYQYYKSDNENKHEIR